MAQSSRPCQGCGALIYRDKPVAPIRFYCSPDCRPRCVVKVCMKPVHSKGMCSAHHTRYVNYGDAEAPLMRTPNVGTCALEGCEQRSRKRGWCASHYSQWNRSGEVRPFAYKWGTGGYNPTHRFVARLKGSAATFCCVDCLEPANEWSYTGDAPDEQTDDQGRRYSRDPSYYTPRCTRCHRFFDKNPIAMRSLVSRERGR